MLVSNVMKISYKFFSYKSSFSQVEMVNPYEVHVIFRDIGYKVNENILHQFVCYSFFIEIFTELRSVFSLLKLICWKIL